MGRILSGEAPIVAGSIKLRKDTYSLAAGRQTTQEDIFDIFLPFKNLPETFANSYEHTPWQYNKKPVKFEQGLDFLKFWRSKSRKTQGKQTTNRQNLEMSRPNFLIRKFLIPFFGCMPKHLRKRHPKLPKLPPKLDKNPSFLKGEL